MEPLAELVKIIKNSRSMVFFGGAGVSTESGIPDFRSENGLYSAKNEFGYEPEDILSRGFLANHPKEFFSYYKKHVVYADAKPNDAHLGLAQLESAGILSAVITQNIDGLHQAAGSRSVVELHGSIHRNTCIKCGRKFCLEYVCSSEDVIPYCDICGGIVRPDIVLYNELLGGEVLPKAIEYLQKADTLIVAGTSLSVYPAARLVRYFYGSKLVVINRSKTEIDKCASLVISSPVGEVFNKIMKETAE